MDACVAGECPTWFREAGDGACECGSSLGSEIQCDNVTGHVSLAFGYCMTYDNVSGEMHLVTGFTNYDYLGGRNRVYTTLPDDVTELNDFMCKNKSRHGFLCGECDPGYSCYQHFTFYLCRVQQCIRCGHVYTVCYISHDHILYYCYHVSAEYSVRTNAWLHHILSDQHCNNKE